jgi:hypothetical protein
MQINRIRSIACRVALCLCLAVSASALPAQTINYQGYLTEPAGGPVEGTVSVTFAIYTAPGGGVPLWTEMQSVDVQAGLFSTELGTNTVGNPLDPEWFDVPLWLGIAVGTDTEMTPRRPFTAAASALNASEAQSLQGASAAELDQSDHVADAANPHAVTAAQTGAAQQTALDAESAARVAGDDAQAATLVTHAGMSAAHHAPYNDTQAVAAMGAQDDTNPLHHTRYTDAEAVTAMGSTGDANPLNHDRYEDASAVQAILAADGAGSTLDADTLDGLEPQNIALLATTGSAFPKEVPLTGLQVGGVPVRLPPTPASDPVLIGDSFGVLFSVIGVTGGEPWTGDALRFQALPEHGEITLRYRYPIDLPSPLDDWLSSLFGGTADVREVEITIDDTVEFGFRATPAYVNRITLDDSPVPLIEETVGLRLVVTGPNQWRFDLRSPPEPGNGPYDVSISGRTFNGNVSFPDARLIPTGPFSNVLVRGELVLHDVGFEEFFQTDLRASIENAVGSVTSRFDVQVGRAGITLLTATGCLATEVNELLVTGIGAIRVVCASPL